jgi:ubiquinone/menaquinone biosynthesis C-methylase UbiE
VTGGSGAGGEPPIDYRRLYREGAAAYDRLVSAEDADGSLLPALAAVAELAGARVLEVGAGTGRLTRLLAPVAGRIVATERSWPMLDVARGRLPEAGGARFCCAEAGALPVRGDWADLALAGWVFGHFLEWMPDGWRGSVAAALAEMRRALRPGGTLVVLETLGTGAGAPAPPTPDLAEYYAWLEDEHGFARREVRTDFEFRSHEEAVELVRFFFGAELGEAVRRGGGRRVPEYTGLWSLRT